MKLLLRALVLSIFLLPLTASAHGIYTDWKMPDFGRGVDGARHNSCCNETDCKPRQTKKINDQWFVLWEDPRTRTSRWLPVPAQKVETNYDDEWNPGDNMGHACISDYGNIYCFRPGEDLF